MHRQSATAFFACATIAACAHAQTFLITQGDTYYRYSAGSLQTYTLGNEITGLTTVPAGTTAGNQNGGAASGDVFAVANGDGGNTAYRLNNPLATPSLTQVGVMGGGGNNSPCFANGKLYGVLLGVNFLEYHPTTLAANNTWNTGVFGGSGGLVHDSGNSFLFVEALNDALFAYTIGGTAADVGPLGVDFDNSALESYQSTIYAALGRVDTGQLVLGTVSRNTGAFTQIDVIDTYRGGSIGLAVVPTPGTLALLSLGGALAARRRRAPHPPRPV
ncbi:MAG: hypothetical protein ACF8LK_09515 [Phycisphaerales bacterium JB041]